MTTYKTEVSIVIYTTVPLTWSVEVINTDDDGGVDVTLFSGPKAETRAREYAEWKYDAVYPKLSAA
jgi:hypothetical protein